MRCPAYLLAMHAAPHRGCTSLTCEFSAVNEHLPRHPEYKQVRHREMKKKVLSLAVEAIDEVNASKEQLLKKEETRFIDQLEEVGVPACRPLLREILVAPHLLTASGFSICCLFVGVPKDSRYRLQRGSGEWRCVCVFFSRLHGVWVRVLEEGGMHCSSFPVAVDTRITAPKTRFLAKMNRRSRQPRNPQ